jgi:hypothetical protein
MAERVADVVADSGDSHASTEKNTVNKKPASPAYVLDNSDEENLETSFTVEQAQVHNNPDVLFEEYLYYAQITRAEERAYEGNLINRKDPWSLGGIIKNRFSKGHQHVHEVDAVHTGETIVTTHNNVSTVTDLEWRRASRALRTASWGSIFFLITTDILGPQAAA